MPQHRLKLYIAGHNSRSEQASANLQRLCAEELAGRYQLIVLDILANPQLAADERILATPVVVKELPLPVRRVIGDFANTEQVLLGLGLLPRTATDSVHV